MYIIKHKLISITIKYLYSLHCTRYIMFKKLDTKKYVRLYYVFPNISGISFQWTYTL